MKEVRKCAVCQKYFIATRYNTVCCSDECKRKRQSQLQAVYKLQCKEAENKPKKRSKKSITDIAVEARKAGMTYGQYVAKMGL